MPRYQTDISIKKVESGKKYYGTVLPADPIEETISYTYTTRVGDRWDTIAYKYLGSAALWYVIANVNGGFNGSIFIKPGTIIKIPEKY